MYTFRPCTERAIRLRDAVRNRLIVADPSKYRIQMEAEKLYKKYPPILQKAYMNRYVMERIHLNIQKDEYFVGGLGHKGWGEAHAERWMMVDIENTWPILEDGLHHAPLDDPYYSYQKLAVSPEDLKELHAIFAEKFRLSGGMDALDWAPDGAEQYFETQATDYGKLGGFPLHMPPGHLTPGFQNIMKSGYGAIRRQAREWLDAHEGNIMGDDIGKYMFYKAAEVSCDAVEILSHRYAEMLRGLAAGEDTAPEKKAEYLDRADSLDWIATETPRTFWEACQMAMLYNCYLKTDNDPYVTSLGRFDQYTWPYLKKELDEGTITLEQAQEYVDGFFLKINTFWGGGFGKIAQEYGVGVSYQHTTIGGVIPETGEDATNEITYMVLETMARLELNDPTISLRVNQNTPKKLWDLAMEAARRVGGLPLLQNDEVIIPAAMRELGFSLEDARNFAFIGCQEITGSGNDYPAPNGSSMGHAGIFWAIVLDMTLNNGVNPINGAKAPDRVCSGYLTDFKTYDELLAAYEKMCDYMLTWSATLNNLTEHEFYRLFPYPNLSISIEGCMESGKDVSEGGAKYNSFGGKAVGLATTADSLTALKYMIYDHHYVDQKTYLDAILANWEGPEYEALRQRVLNEVPHYGNNDPYADAQMKYVIDLYYNMSRRYCTERASVYKCGTFGASDHVVQGEITWATPDGRKTGEPIADASSPAQGRDTHGPTSVFNSSTFFDHSRFMDGMALNVKIHPTALAAEGGVTKLENITQAYFDNGGMEVQYNILDNETLRKAQADPDSYHNLVVRIAGFSAYFVDMTEQMQNDIISRYEHKI